MRAPGVKIVGALGVAALTLACFGGVLFAHRQFAYRDAGSFYYPLYLRVQQEWDAGRLPLWQSEENGGAPLLGNPTAAVLYPGKILYGVLPYSWAARVYIIAHVLLACAGATSLGRTLGISAVGSWIVGLAYAFGGPVLFQYANVVFLVGAAWLPWGWRGVVLWVGQGRRRGVIWLAVVLALQTLGGDPEVAYLTVVGAAVYGLGRTALAAWKPPVNVALLAAGAVLLVWCAGVLVAAWWSRMSAGSGAEQDAGGGAGPWVFATLVIALLALASHLGRKRPEIARGRIAFAGLIVAGALAGSLCAAQLLPVVEFSRLSVRAAENSPIELYRFSFEPYRVAELVWPNVFGRTHPENHSWLLTIDPRRGQEFWVPSLYLGGMTTLLALGAIGFGDSRRGWLTVLAVLSLLGSFGQFGSPLWAMRMSGLGTSTFGPLDALSGVPRTKGGLLDAVGGLYWLMVHLLPGFIAFRYPGKFLIVTSLAIALLGGLGWDRLSERSSRSLFVVATGLLVVSLLALITTFLARDFIVAAWSRGSSGATTSGPLDAAAALDDLRRGLIQGGTCAAAVLGLAWLLRRRPGLSGGLAIAFLTLDLALASSVIVWTVPQGEFERIPDALRVIEAAERIDPSPGPFRIHRARTWYPLGFVHAGSQDRVKEVVAWECDTLQPEYALPLRRSYTLTTGTLELYDYAWFFRPLTLPAPPPLAQSLGIPTGQPVLYAPRRAFDMWTTRYFILPFGAFDWTDENRGIAAFLPGSKRIYPPPDAFEGDDGAKRRLEWMEHHDWQVLRNEAVFPRAWIVHKARTQELIEGLSEADRVRPMRLLLYQNDAIWTEPSLTVFDLRASALIETGDRSGVIRALPRLAPGETGQATPGEDVVVTRHDPQRVELDAILERAGLVVLADVFYPGWRLRIDGKPAPILRANRAMRAALVPAGKHKLVYEYRPLSVKLGGILSAIGAVGLVVGLVWARRGRFHEMGTLSWQR